MKIFIIEDESAIRVELGQFLLKYGYECESSENYQNIGNESLNSGLALILPDINSWYK